MFWFRKHGETVRVGFTAEGLKELGQIWQFIPRIKVGEKVHTGQAVATVETTTSLRSIVIPLDGVLVGFREELLEQPENLSEETTVFTFSKVNYALLGL